MKRRIAFSILGQHRRAAHRARAAGPLRRLHDDRAARLYGLFASTCRSFETVPPVLICALGLTFVITAGEIDLSFPAVVAFSGFVFAWVFKNFDSPLAPWIGLILALAAGGADRLHQRPAGRAHRRAVDHGDAGRLSSSGTA